MAGKISKLQNLPPFPSSQELKSFPVSKRLDILQNISNTLQQVLVLPKSSYSNSRKQYKDFVASYTRDAAILRLSGLIFQEKDVGSSETTLERLIRKQVLMLADRLAEIPGGLDLQTLVDVAVVYGDKNHGRIQKLVDAVAASNPSFMDEIKEHAIPSFTQLIQANSLGLHGLRKATFCMNAFLQCSSNGVLLLFALNKSFVVSLTESYQSMLERIAAGYGGVHIDRPDETGWDQMWMECKASLIDCFHVLLKELLQQMNNLAVVEYAFDLIFTLLDLPSTTRSFNSTPFVDCSLLNDYQQAYSLSSTLASLLANRDDARLDLLDSRLKDMELQDDGDRLKRLGGLKLLIGSNGIMPGIDNRGDRKGKQKASAQITVDDLEVTKVLDLFPDNSPDYIRRLLALPNYSNNAERVIEGLLEGTVPTADSLNEDTSPLYSIHADLQNDMYEYTRDRHNVFDGDTMRPENLTVGKRQMQANDLLNDRKVINHLKEDILRRIEAFSDSEDELEHSVHDENSDDDVLADDTGVVRIAGDGEDSGEEEQDQDAQIETSQDPQTLLELAYIRDPKLFDRDATTRRSKWRADLKSQTGWSDEQIEGWRIMLERNPKKDKILQKHEFAGNQPVLPENTDSESIPSSASRGRGGSSRARGRGGSGAPGRGGAPGNADGKERAWKNKNKSSRGNHNRKRGHDKKLARGMGSTVS